MIVLIFAVAAVAYLIGSINFGIVVSKSRHKKDVRDYGSGNAGATNTLRTFGKTSALLVMLGDMLKGALVIWVAKYALTGFALSQYFVYVAGVAVLLGHIFPVFFGFRGGKGVSTTAGIMLAFSPVTFLILLSVFIIVLCISKYVSLSSITAVILYAPVNALIYYLSHKTVNSMEIIFPLIVAVIVVFLHRQNIGRLIHHNESKISFKK